MPMSWSRPITLKSFDWSGPQHQPSDLTQEQLRASFALGAGRSRFDQADEAQLHDRYGMGGLWLKDRLGRIRRPGIPKTAP